MKKLVTGILASLLLANSLPALADRGQDRHFRSERHGPPAVYYRDAPRHHHGGGYGAPLAWGIAGLALGSVLYAVSSPPPVMVAPVVSPPPRPPGRMWYYCEPYQAYYPNVQNCPEAWRAVPGY